MNALARELKAVLLFIVLVFPTIGQTKALDIHRWKTKEGMKVLFVKESSAPLVDVSISFWAGSAFDDKNWGLSALCNELLLKGAGEYSEQSFSEAIESLGSQLDNSVTQDLATVSLRTLSKPQNLETSFRLFTLMLEKPRFETDAFNLTRLQQKHAIKLNLQSPSTFANQKMYEILYQSHPYAHPILGQDSTLDNLTPLQVKAFFKDYYAANRATLSIVGDLSLSRAKQLSKALSSKLRTSKQSIEIPSPTPLKTSLVRSVTFNSNQTAIRIGQLGIDYHSPHYFPLTVGNYILGGSGLTSRLALEVREKRGLTYGVYSGFYRMKEKGPFMISLSSQTQSAKEALVLSQKTLSNFLKSGPTDTEVTKAKQFLNGSFPIQLSTNKKISELLVRMGSYNLPDDYLDTYLSNLNKVSASKIKEHFNQVMDENSMAVLMVGKDEKS